MTHEAWKRWGEDDERGALNHIGSVQVQEAAALVRSGQVLSLAQTLSPRTPVPPHRAGIQHFMGRDGGDYAAGARRPGGFQFAEDTVVLPLHIGAHIDALCHAWYDDALYNGFPGSGTRSTSGATRCGIDKMGPIVGRGVLLDVAGVHGGPLRDGAAIGPRDLDHAAKRAGIAVGKGDVVLIRTGWAEHQGRADNVSFDGEPGLDVDAALWLAEREIAALGADNFAVEVIPFAQGAVFPVHQRLIRDYGVPLLEGLLLHGLAATGRHDFLFVAGPLPVLGGTGSPINPIAILQYVTMRALVLREPGSVAAALHCETIPEPSPRPHQVVIRVAFCGVCSHDVAVCIGVLRSGIGLPCVPGHEVAGTVVAVGESVGDFSIGDRVATTQREHVCGHCRYCRSGREPLCAEQVFLGDTRLNGGFAEYVAVDADNVVSVPDDVALDAAAIASCAIGTMLHAVRAVGRIAPGDRVMVTGAGGGLGMHGVQLAKRAGGWVIAQTTSARKVEALKEYGADAVVVASRDSDFSADVKAATDGEGVDCVLDTVGTPVFTPTRRSLARGGRWVLIGQLNGGFVPFNPAQLFLKGISMLSATSTTREELRLCLDMLRPGGIRAVLGACFPLTRAAEALALVKSGAATGRVVLSVGG